MTSDGMMLRGSAEVLFLCSHVCPEGALGCERDRSYPSLAADIYITSRDILLLKRAQTRFELRAGEAVGEIQGPFSNSRSLRVVG